MPDVMVPSVLADAYSRAGASDRDREAWLAERRQGVTATEVRDLWLRKVSVQDLVDLKLGRRDDTFTGNGYTRWGSEREAVVAGILAGAGFEAESRVFHHPTNSRYLASPDGLRVNFDDELEVLEIKTAGSDLDDDMLWKKGYLHQLQWNLWVLGAARGLIVVEERLEGAVGFQPGNLFQHWVERDDALIADLVGLADGFLASLDDMRENGVDPVAVALLEDVIAATERQKAAREALEQYCASTGLSSLRSPSGSMSYSTPAPRRVFQPSLLKDAYPDLYQEFTQVVSASKPTLRITARKGAEDE